ncbi:MAG: translation initiation factor IF-3 [Candidatus Pacebacteria bacterium]|nr:translation initiation factor IF-3 [Candidatus Paceibacterota bacterium]
MVIDEDGKQLGLMKTEDALNLAFEKDLDLAEVSPNLNPPVCKIIDYGKYLYKIAKQKRQQSAKQKKTETKGIRISVRIEKHDLEFKAKNAIKFLKKGDLVKIDMILKGREKANRNFAYEKFNDFLQMISEISKEDKEAEEREIIKEHGIKKTPQGFNIVIEYKKK